jgi:VWFA-related protein
MPSFLRGSPPPATVPKPGSPYDPKTIYRSARTDQPVDYSPVSRYLRELADRSGGRLNEAETTANLNQAFALIAADLRHQYALSYYPANAARDGSFRRIRVRVDRPGVIVRTRDGYRAAGAEAAPGNGTSK